MKTSLFLNSLHTHLPLSSIPLYFSLKVNSSSSKNSKKHWELLIPILILQKLVPLSVKAQIAVEQAG